MILGRDRHVHSGAFDEINTAVEALTDRVVCFNCHSFPNEIPDGAIVYQMENVGEGYEPSCYNREVWDFSARNVERAPGATYVPIGYHPSMERFERAKDLDIDVVFSGSLNKRRIDLLNTLEVDHHLKVAYIPHTTYGKDRDKILSRARLALNPLFYVHGVHPILRSAHLVSNNVPVLSETCPEVRFHHRPYEDMVTTAVQMLKHYDRTVEFAKLDLYDFKETPLVLPE